MLNSDNSLLEAAKEKKRVAAKAYYEKHRAQILAKRRAKRLANHQEALAKERAYRAQNPEKVKQWQENYWMRKAQAEHDAK